MLTACLERSSAFVMKVGMPLVYAYHIVLSSTFLTTSATDAKGLERLANSALISTHYLLEAKQAIPIYNEGGRVSYRLERKFDYDHHFFVKTAASVITLPLSLTLGSALKGLSYLSKETRIRADRITASSRSRLSLI